MEEDFDAEFRVILVKITDLMSPDELNKLRFLFYNKIKRGDYVGTTIDGAIDLFRQLLDRAIIDRRNLSNLISALDDVGCRPAAQLLKDYQSTITKQRTLLEEISFDNEPDNHPKHDFSQETDGRSSNPQQDFLLNNNTNRTSRLTLYGKTNTKITIIKCLMLLIIFLTYTIILIVLTHYVFLKLSPLKKPVPIDNQLVHNRAKFCQPSPSERYFIRSRYSGKLIGVVNNTSDQWEQLRQWNDNQNQLCNHQWYFLPLPNQGKDKIYIIQSVYNRKVFDISGGNSSDENQIQQWDMTMNNVNQRFRLIYVPNEDSCQIQSLATDKVLNAITKEFITQADLEIKEKESMAEKYKTLWQLIPFDIDRPGDKLTDCPYVSSMNDLTVIKFGNVFGSDGGYSTDDSKNFRLTLWHYISSISIISSDWINSIECIYSSMNPLSTEPPKSGIVRGSVGIYNNNYQNGTFNVTEKDSYERIDRVNMIINIGKDYPKVSARYIAGIQFHTTFNRTSPFYGSRQGQLYMEEYPGFVLGYVRGGTYMYIERLQFIWYKI